MRIIYSYSFILLISLISVFSLKADIISDTTALKMMKDDTAKVNLLNNVSDILKDFDPEKGIEFGKKSYKLSLQLKYKKGIAYANRVIGLNYWRIGVYEAALENFLNALDLFDELKDSIQICKAYNNIGLIYFSRNQFDKAFSLLEKGLLIAEKINNAQEKSRLLHNIALVKFEFKQLDEAVSFHKNSINYALDSKDSVLLSYNYCFLGKCYSYLKKFDSAEVYLNKSIDLFKQQRNPNNTAMAYNQFAEYLFQRGDFREAIKYAFIGYHLGLKIGNRFLQMEASESLYKNYQKLNDFKNALEFALIHFNLSDSLMNEKNLREIAEKDANYNYHKKLKKFEIEKEKELYRSNFITKAALISAVLLFVIAMIAIAFYRLRTRSNNSLQQKNNEISSLNAELSSANSTKDKFFSIIAHDLKNPIGNSKEVTKVLADNYDFFTEEERKEFLQILKDSSDKVYSLLENLLDWSRTQRKMIDFKPLTSDIYNIASIAVEVSNLAASNKQIIINNTIPPETFVHADPNLINIVLRNIITNAVKFSYSGGEIRLGLLESSENENFITVFVKDSGIGMNKDTLDKLFRIEESIKSFGTAGETGTGLGLILCKEFIELHNGKIWAETSPDNGSTFFFTLPKAN